jgi:hypothetical protein
MKVVADELKKSLKNVCFADSRWFSSKSNLFADPGFVDEMTLNVSFAETFAKRQVSYKLINCWTLNSDIDIYVCNDLDRFQLNRIIDSNDQLIVDKIVYDIESYETMNIVVREFDDSINIQLLNVALMFEFLINLICLIKIMKKEVHWDIES